MPLSWDVGLDAMHGMRRNVCIATNYLQTLKRLHASANMAWVELEGRICVGQTFLFCGGEDFFQ